jgi:ketosteroid isomerase-like protein
MTAPRDALAVAELYTAAVNGGDAEALRALHEPDARIWHNTDGATQTVGQNMAVLAWLRRIMPDLALADVRRLATAEGFVQRHTVVGTAHGSPVAVPTCLVVELSPAGRIRLVEEYLDSAGLAALQR